MQKRHSALRKAIKNAATQGFELKSLRRKLEGGTLCERNAATQGKQSKTLRRELEGGTLCERSAATQGNHAKTLRRCEMGLLRDGGDRDGAIWFGKCTGSEKHFAIFAG